MQVLGLIRFSFAAEGGFKTTADTPQELYQKLYAPARMEQRFALFEHLCLPPLRAQTDPDFKIAVLTGEAMPEPYLLRLEALLSDLPQCTLVALPMMNQMQAASRIINGLKDNDGDPVVAHVRLDDDDTFALTFVEEVKATFNRVRGLFDAGHRLSLDFNKGYALAATGSGILTDEVNERRWTPAQVVFLHKSNTRTIMKFHHRRRDKVMPTVILNKPTMYIRTVNDFNDSGIADYGDNLLPATPEHKADIARLFGIDIDAMHAAVRPFLLSDQPG